jgi:UDPglucose 6-dehydrogenase
LKISYANLIDGLCEKLGGNVEEVTRAMGLDPRIGPHFLNAGLGFGGFCLPKDIQAFIHLAEKHGVDFSLLEELRPSTKGESSSSCQKVRGALWVVKEKKAIRRLIAEGATVRASDPEAISRARALLDGAEFVEDPYEVARGADALLLLTEWKEYRDLDWKHIYREMARPLVLDARNMLAPAKMKELGFEYYSFGRPT